MKYYYDFHIHSDLSPCADRDMTPNNIANMAFIKGLKMIAVTDHNCIKNYNAIKKITDELDIILIPGMEITTKEDVHILSYFRDYNDAESVGELIYESLPDIPNKPDIFGEQNIYADNDEIVDKVNKLLINASKYSIEEIDTIVRKNNGVIVPAHVNKKSNGILGVLGFFPFDTKFSFIELPKNAILDDRTKKIIRGYEVLINSDAHMLEAISEPESYIELDDPEDIYRYLGIK